MQVSVGKISKSSLGVLTPAENLELIRFQNVCVPCVYFKGHTFRFASLKQAKRGLTLLQAGALDRLPILQIWLED